ncbi:protein HEG homolog 1-like isoform X2 [Pecten maximus]|uniref:protein HEG homolog 1-like isoform X2 n=1 Tax=Pecten maximus TaxID=6579 RepID=UPI00145900A4|nr:protein HEG homolog 1-like isoform X2 [Pecten maximus]
MSKVMSVVQPVTVIFIIILAHCEAQFLGGSINWYLLNGKVRFTYRMTWEKGTGPCGAGCSQASVNTPGTLHLPLTILNWKCTSGCSGNSRLHDVNYVTTSVGSAASSWEQGEGSFLFTPPVANGKYEITLSTLRWSTQANGPGQLQTTVDLRIRSDTNLPNASPIAAVQPTIGIPSGCMKTIPLPVIDPDADRIKCRLAGPTECGAACTTLTGIHVDHDKCTVTVPGTLKMGDYRLAVVVEDYPRSVIKLGGATSNYNQPLSNVPLQLTVHVTKGSGGCGPLSPGSTDTGPTVVYPPSGLHSRTLHTVHVSAASQSEVIISTSAGVTATQTPDLGHPGSVVVDTHWTPKSDQDGPAFTCVWALQHDGSTTQQHCFTTYVRDQDNCNGGNKCLHGGTCVDLYKRFTCKCLGGFTSNDCSVRASCVTSNPCVNGTCEERHGSLFCICSPGYTGQTCDTKVDHCVSSPCLHGGTCTDKVTGSSCACTAQYTGSHCETRIKTPQHSTGPSVTASLQYIATVSSDSQGIQIVDYVKVAGYQCSCEQRQSPSVANRRGLWRTAAHRFGRLRGVVVLFRQARPEQERCWTN